MLKLDGVSKVYKVGTFGGKRLLAVNNVSFDVQDREVVSLIGESGSGKTTIGKMILHLASISSGTIRLDGVDVSSLKGNALKEYYRKVQGVFQDPFSSYNPIFKADRIFRTIREEFFPEDRQRRMEQEDRQFVEGGWSQPRRGREQVSPPAERWTAAALSHRACSAA